MKILFALALTAMVVSNTNAQQQSVTIKNGDLSQSNYSNMDSFYAAFNGETIVLTADTKGSPYVNPKFQLGSIIKNGEPVMKNIALRYNAYNDIILGKQNLQIPDTKSLNVIKSPDYQIKIGNDIFVAIPSKTNVGQSQYYQLILEGEKATLYLKHTVSYKERIQATSSMTRDSPALFKMHSDYFFGDADGNVMEIPSSKKKAAKLFGASEAKIKTFIKEHKLNMSDEGDLKRLFQYYNTL